MIPEVVYILLNMVLQMAVYASGWVCHKLFITVWNGAVYSWIAVLGSASGLHYFCLRLDHPDLGDQISGILEGNMFT